ncbi:MULTISPECIES: glycoside hydrolase family 5 protein [Streptomyces]|uniref:Cellulase family glycosylhydrolase n=1 Tax=Streptomyces siderophoricus TaxID=2802281 RepID=A0ABS1N1I9_9ACTN|nr:cellulase family glycosylhydrolase [Streptomyces sp. 9-7]MBL1093936.1 cellulase family glycosylhydrolase [Streptomyces sp. 9-7]
MRRPLLPALLVAALLLGALGAPGAAASTAPLPAAPAVGKPKALVDSWRPPLSTRGRYIVDADGKRFKLKSANWHGAQGSWNGSGDITDPANHHDGEKSDQMPLGLDRAPIPKILAGFHELGINSIRLPFSNEMLHDTRPVPDSSVAANPQLRGRTPLQVLDAVVAATTGEGFAVVLNNHTNTSRFCCGLDGNERWNTSQSTTQWEDDWLSLARRYKGNKRVVGADLYNEVRRTVTDDANWNWGDSHDWWAASQHLGDRLLTEANPDLLVVVEGINWQGIPADGLFHWRPTLEPVRTVSHTLVASNKLVYSAHFYGYTGPNHTGATGMGETHDPRYQELSREDLFATLRRQAFYVTEAGRHYTAPLWISEFGIGRDETNPQARAWFGNFVDYLIDQDTDFAFWPLVGWTGHGTWPLINFDTAGRRSGILDGGDWRTADWKRLVAAPQKTGQIADSDIWDMLNLDHADAVQSARVRKQGDWDPGARKGVCPDGQRLIGLAHRDGRGLCTDAGAARPAGPDPVLSVVHDERHVQQGDWASGYTKYQCGLDQFMIGYSVRGQAVSGVLCAKASRPLSTDGRTVWFDRSDDRPAGDPGGEFAQGTYKGQCRTDEFAAGIAFTHAWAKSGTPDALLCRKL